MRYPIWLLLVCAGCAARVSPHAGIAPAAAVRAQDSVPVAAAAPPPEAPPLASAPAANPEAPVAEAASEPADGCALSAEDLESEEEELAEGEGDDGEKETPDAVATGAASTGPLYTADISDEELARRWKDEIASLGSMAVGFAHSGRLVNAKQFPQGDDWIVVTPAGAWATEESVNYLADAIRDVRARFPNAPPLRVNGMSHKEGGYMRPHKSHQNGRDVDVGFYYPTVDPIRTRAREHVIDVAMNWEFIRSVLVKTDVQMILVDRRVRKVIYDHAVRAGEDKAWLDSIFNDGPTGIVRHARGHRDHFHIRFHNPRAQELGRRVQPFLALQPEHNVMTHRIRNGDTLGGIALKYGSSVAMIKKANRMRNNFLRAGNRLSVPLRGPCTHCPVPPPFVLPDRRLPPDAVAPAMVAAAPAAKATPENGCARPAATEAIAAQQSGSVVPVVGAASVEAASTVLSSAPAGEAAPVVKAAEGTSVDVASAVQPAVASGVKPAAGGALDVAAVKPANAVNVASTVVPVATEQAAASSPAPAVQPTLVPMREKGEGAAGITHGR